MKRTGRYSSIQDPYYTGDWGNNHGAIPINMARYAIHKYISNNKAGVLGRIGNSFWDKWRGGVAVLLNFENREALAFHNMDKGRFTKTDEELKTESKISSKYAFGEAASIAIENLCLMKDISASNMDKISIRAFYFEPSGSIESGALFFDKEGNLSVVIKPSEEEQRVINGFEHYPVSASRYAGRKEGSNYLYS
jgi:hypothetical protein